MKMYINGDWCGSENGATIDVINPATEELLDTVPDATPADVNKAVAAAKAAFDGWRKTPVIERSEMIREMARKLEDNMVAYATLLTKEQGKVLAEHLGDEIGVSIHCIDYYAQLIKNSIGRVLPSDQRETFNFVIKEPYGPTACIVPFNYPLLLLFWKIAPALAAGNTVIVKPSEKTPLATLKLAEDVLDHFPKGVVNIITGGVVAGNALATHPDVPTVAFTGSTKVGTEIIKSTAHQIKNLLLELGGKDAAVVSEDMNIKLAAKALTASALWNTGQICTSTERVYVQRAVYDDFLDEITKRFQGVTMGNGLDENVDIGPMVDSSGFAKVELHIQDALDKGARVLTGGKRSDEFDKGFFFEPTVLADVNHDMLCMTEETFGPTIAVMPYDDFQEAVDLVNGTDYGLGAVIMSMDPVKIKRFFEDVKAGSVWINDPLPDNIAGPFGGMKTSALGDYRELGQEGLEAFMETKHVHWTFEPEKIQDMWFGEEV